MIDGLTLNKLLPALALPSGLAFWLCCYGAWKRKRWPVAAGLALVAIAGCPVVADGLLWTLEANYQGPWTPDRGYEAVLVLGGYMEDYQGEDREPQWAAHGERLEAGIRLVKQGRAGMLVLSAGDDRKELSQGERARRVAVARGVAEEKILVTGPVLNTEDEARAMAAIARARGWTRLGLVTSAFHMRRAMLQFSSHGIGPVALATDFNQARQGRLAQDLVPNAEGLMWSERALREWMGIGYYTLRRLL
ncbi:MAG: YdcF family protein [Bryobacteraceae bacterium]|nr:YdcF family protein [Bryobacteraceae bacterium]